MERSKDWLDEAHGDLEHARNDMECGFHNWACFSAQQSAEKAIKAIDKYLLDKGLSKKNLPRSVEAYRKALKKYLSVCDGELLSA